jgi:phosphomannomutase/phosphoglucomutase
MEGLCASGVDVADIGMVPTPLGYFAAHHLKTGSAVMVTGSHNPPDYNGFKMVLGGDTLHSTAIQALRTRLEAGLATAAAASGRWMCARITSSASSPT